MAISFSEPLKINLSLDQHLLLMKSSPDYSAAQVLFVISSQVTLPELCILVLSPIEADSHKGPMSKWVYHKLESVSSE